MLVHPIHEHRKGELREVRDAAQTRARARRQGRINHCPQTIPRTPHPLSHTDSKKFPNRALSALVEHSSSPGGTVGVPAGHMTVERVRGLRRQSASQAAEPLDVRRGDLRLATESDMAADLSRHEVGAIPRSESERSPAAARSTPGSRRGVRLSLSSSGSSASRESFGDQT